MTCPTILSSFVGLLFFSPAILNYMNALDELHSLVQDLRLHIAQEYPDIQLPERTHMPAKIAPVAAQAVAQVVALPKPPASISKPPPKQEPIKPAIVVPKPKAAEIPTTPLEPIMQALARPFVKPAQISLADCIQKLEKLGVHTLDAPQEPQVLAHRELVVVSFFPPASEEEKFIQKVAASVSERIMPCSIYLQPGLSAAAECFTLAASSAAKAVVIAYAQDDAQKLSQWLAYFGDDLKDGDLQKSELRSKRTLFTVSFYDLIVTPTTLNDTAFKRALWNDLQAILCQ